MENGNIVHLWRPVFPPPPPTVLEQAVLDAWGVDGSKVRRALDDWFPVLIGDRRDINLDRAKRTMYAFVRFARQRGYSPAAVVEGIKGILGRKRVLTR